MGFWHTGYAEFHEPTGLGPFADATPAPVRFACEHCGHSFSEIEALRKHRFEQHPLRQPALLVRGQPVGSQPMSIFSPLHANDVMVEDAMECLVNGDAVEAARLGEVLSPLRHRFVQIELRNQGAITPCLLDFRVADEDHLAGVESAFVRLARDRVLSIEAISRFNDDCRAFLTAMPYCDGVAHYLYGVMAKERSSDSGLKHEEYIARFSRANDQLAGFERPLARSVRALVAFHFNHFDDAEVLAPDGALRHAAGAFANLLQGLPWHFDAAFSSAPGGAVEDLLTDQDTLQILADASEGLVGLKARADELLSHLRRTPVAGYDRLKRALLVCEALAARDEPEAHADARKLARSLVGKPDTSVWAKAMLERLAPR